MSSTQPTFDDILRLFKEADERFKQMDKEFEETKRLIREASMATDRKIKEVSASIGKLGNRLGDFIEDAVRPAAMRLFQSRGIIVHEVQQNVSAQRGEEGLEIDLMLVNDTEAVAVECKINLKIDDVNEHLERLAKLKRLLPLYISFKVMGAVAAMVIPDNVARYAASKLQFSLWLKRRHSGMDCRNPVPRMVTCRCISV